MGLDVHLKKYPGGYRKAKEAEENYEQAYNNLVKQGIDWAEIKEILEEDRKVFGLNEYGYVDPIDRMDSKKYPDHLFKIGYWRSAYNTSGLNRILNNNDLSDLYDICLNRSQERYSIPRWDAIAEKAREAVERFKDAEDLYHVSYIFNSTKKRMSSKDALKLMVSERDRRFKKFSSKNGWFDFSDKPDHIYAIIPSSTNIYIISALEDRWWYQQALEIVEETVLWILDQPDKEAYYLSWSG